MTQVVSSKVEMEGLIEERVSLWSGQALPPWPANADLTVVGCANPRVDAVAKVTGRARYTEDRTLPGLLHCKVLRSPYAHARIQRIETSRAATHPGVRAVICCRTAPSLLLPNGQPLFDRIVRFWGQPVAAVAAETEDQAWEALGQIQVAYEPLPFVIDEYQAVKDGDLVRVAGAPNPIVYQRGDLTQGEGEADLVVECTFRTPAVVHQCMEAHCGMCTWDDGQLTIWTSTQYVHGVAADVAEVLKLAKNQVRVISESIGGGFGSKQFAGEEVLIPALLARRAGQPVRLVLDRRAESVATGYREPTRQRIRLGARRDGTLTFIDHAVAVGNGAYGAHPMAIVGPTKTLYRCPNVRTEETLAATNLAPARAFRAPGYTEGMFALESAMDELARRLGIDPLTLRRRNEVDFDQVRNQSYTIKPIDDAYCLGAAAVGWGGPKPAPTKPGRRRGRGMASQIWGGGGGPPAYAWVKLLSDGTAVVIIGAQDIGTGTRTAFAQIAAAELGYRLDDVRVADGDTLFGPYGPNSGGSQTVASVGPAVRLAAHQARRTLLEVCAQLLHQPLDSLTIKDSAVSFGPADIRCLPVREVFEKTGNFSILGQGDRAPNPRDLTINTFGAQFAEVEIDEFTGDVFLLRQVAVHDCGRVISPLQARSQIQGGITQGIGFALMEELIVDPATGVVLNPNLEHYSIPTIADIPVIDGRLLGMIDPLDNSIGVKGLGEPPIIPVAPAIANAISDALGVRIHDLPITRAKVLAAMRHQEQRRA